MYFYIDTIAKCTFLKVIIKMIFYFINMLYSFKIKYAFKI